MTLGADKLEHRRFRVREAPNLRAEGAQARVDMSLYELIETAQAILISYILIDGSLEPFLLSCRTAFPLRLRAFRTQIWCLARSESAVLQPSPP